MPRGELGAIVGGGLVAIGLLLDGPWAIAVLLLAVVVGVWGLVTASRSD